MTIKTAQRRLQDYSPEISEGLAGALNEKD